MTTFYLYKTVYIITQIFRDNMHESNEYVFLSKQTEKYREAIKQSMHRNAKYNTQILKKFNMGRPLRRNITTERFGYKTQKLRPRIG